MSGAEEALESAIIARLAANAEVKALLGDPPRVFQAATGRPAYPYLEIVRHDVEPAGGAGVEASTHRIDLAIVTHNGGPNPMKEAVGVVRAALAGTPPVMDDWRCVLLLPVFWDMARTRFDGWRAVIRLKAVTEPA